MEKAERLKRARDLLLRHHKVLVDFERENYQQLNGTVNSGQFLSLLLENPDFAWLREFSMLIVGIDEMFDLDDGFTSEMVENYFAKMRDIIDLKFDDASFAGKYRFALQENVDAAAGYGELKKLVDRTSVDERSTN